MVVNDLDELVRQEHTQNHNYFGESYCEVIYKYGLFLKQDFLSAIVKTSNSYWMGLVEKEEGQWSWVDGTDFSATEQ